MEQAASGKYSLDVSRNRRVGLRLNHDWRENKFSSHSLPMLAEQVRIDFSDQDSAVQVSRPFGNSPHINAAHDRHRTEVMSQVVEARPFKPGLLSRDLE